MKIKKIFSIIIITALCMGKINSQTATPTNLSLSGIQTGNNEYEALNSIQSTQVINSGTTEYTAGNVIVLKPGFQAKAGSEFTATIEDVSHRLTFMTYNLYYQSNKFAEHAEVIINSGADVIAIQEMFRGKNFKRLKEDTNLEGTWYVTKTDGIWWWKDREGIALMWKPALGTPTITKRKVDKIKNYGFPPPAQLYDDSNDFRAYIIAEFPDFCFISTHYPNKFQSQGYRNKMSEAILSDAIVQNCKNSGKPVYIAGDFNDQPGGESINKFTSAGFVVLNGLSAEHATQPNDDHRDMILEYNTNPNRAVIDKGISKCLRDSGEYVSWRFIISDHLPYYVKVKLQ